MSDIRRDDSVLTLHRDFQKRQAPAKAQAVDKLLDRVLRSAAASKFKYLFNGILGLGIDLRFYRPKLPQYRVDAPHAPAIAALGRLWCADIRFVRGHDASASKISSGVSSMGVT